MKKDERKLVIFGAAMFAERMRYYFDANLNKKVVGFVVDPQFLNRETLHDLPVLPFAGMEKIWPPEDHDLFVAIGYSNQNRNREKVSLDAERRGYRLAGFAAPTAVINSRDIGIANVIFDHATIGPFCTTGPGCIFGNNAVVSHHCRIGSYAYISASVTVTGGCTIGDRVFIGAGSTLRDGISIAEGTVVGMGSIVTRDITQAGVYFGQPARLVRQFDT